MQSHYAIKTLLVKAIPFSFGHVVGKGVVLTVQGVEIHIQGCHRPDRQGGRFGEDRNLGFWDF